MKKRIYINNLLEVGRTVVSSSFIMIYLIRFHVSALALIRDVAEDQTSGTIKIIFIIYCSVIISKALNYDQGTIILRTRYTYVGLVSALENLQPNLR